MPPLHLPRSSVPGQPCHWLIVPYLPCDLLCCCRRIDTLRRLLETNAALQARRGAAHPNGTSNIFFTNFSDDPWQSAGVQPLEEDGSEALGRCYVVSSPGLQGDEPLLLLLLLLPRMAFLNVHIALRIRRNELPVLLHCRNATTAATAWTFTPLVPPTPSRSRSAARKRNVLWTAGFQELRL